MNQELDYKDNLITPTGDPFADVGGYVIETLWEDPKLKDKDILGLIEYVANIYISQWNANLHAFFLNSPITQSAEGFKTGKEKLAKTMAYYKSILHDTTDFKTGFCRISGQKTKLFPVGRANQILAGSGAFINFHHGFEGGLYLSKEVIIRFFFVPLGVMQLGDKLGLISSNNNIVAKYFVQQLLVGPDGHLQSIGRNLASGVAVSNQRIPANALFAFADSCIKSIKSAIVTNIDQNVVEVRDTILSLFHFTNFGAKAEVVLYQVQAMVFRFYVACQAVSYAEYWRPFVAAHYRNSKYKDARYIQDSDTWVSAKEELAYDSYSTWRNVILERLLNGETLIPYFKEWLRKHKFDFQIVENYLFYVKNMDKRTLQKIKEVAGFIVSRDEDSIKKAILRLNRAKYVQEVRQYLLKLINDHYVTSPGTPLIRLDDVEYLFPETVSWREIRDLLLIAIYEKLHDNHMVVPTEIEEQEVETPENE